MIKAADTWRTNGDLIADVAELWFPAGPAIADLTYGLGNWWSVYNPITSNGELYTNDLDPTCATDEHTDFRHLAGWADDEFDVVAFDPPYVSVGGRKTSTIKDHHQRYGMDQTPTTPLKLWLELIVPGLIEATRICKPGGLILFKTMNYISSGNYQNQLGWSYSAAAGMGLQLEDQFILVGQPGRQSQTTQVHARNNYSVLLVFRKPC
jgi:hypothetical protein